MKAYLSQEQMELACACVSALGKTGGEKTRNYSKTLSRADAALSKAAAEAIAELDKKAANM